MSIENDKVFNWIDTFLSYAAQFVLGFWLFFPIVTIIWGVNFDVHTDLSRAEIDEFVKSVLTIKFFLSIAGLAFIFMIMTMFINTSFLFVATIAAFLTAMYIGFGFKGLLVIGVTAFLVIAASKSDTLVDFLIDSANNAVDKWKIGQMKKEEERENVFELTEEIADESKPGFALGFLILITLGIAAAVSVIDIFIR